MSGLEVVYNLVPDFTEWLSKQEIPNKATYVAAGDSASELGKRVFKYAGENNLKVPSIRLLDHKTTWELYFADTSSISILQGSVVGASIYFLEDFTDTGEKVLNFYNCMRQNLGLSVVFTIMVANPNIRSLPTNTRVWKYDQALANLLNSKYDRRRREQL